MTDLPIFSYGRNGSAGLAPPIPIPVDTGDAGVVDLASRRPSRWHVGQAVCLACGLHSVVMVEADVMPERLECPRCAKSKVVPQDHWGHSCQAWCAHCGNAWKTIYADPDDRPDILPVRVRCPRCAGMTEQIEPWPLPS